MEELRPITVRNDPALGHNMIAVQTMDGEPYKLWSLYEYAGSINLATCTDVDVLPTNWEVIDTLAIDAAEAAIVFDGDWVWHHELGAWRLHTEETPWLFWVNSYGVLKAQKYGDELITDLDTFAYGLSAIRAWKNPLYPDLDQGIVVTYIQLGGLFYRNYCMQPDGTLAWENIREIVYPTDALVEEATPFLLNDYRLGIAIEDTLGRTHWIITHRNWAGMASPIENITVGLTDLAFGVHKISYQDTSGDEHITAAISDLWFNMAEPIYPVPIAASNDDEYIIRLFFSHEIDIDLTTVRQAFTIKDSQNYILPILSTEAGVDNAELVFNMENFMAANGELSIIYDRGVIELDCLNQGSRFAIESFTFNFLPYLVPPERFADEHITTGISDIAFDVKRAYYTDMFETENITAGLDIVFTVTKVGDNPL